MSITNIKSFPVLETQRLILRQVNADDAQEIFFLRSDKEVGKYIERSPQKNIKEAKDFIAKRIEDVAECKISYWAIVLKDNPMLIGTICLWNFNENKTIAEVGYDLNPTFQKKGLMSEALNEVIKFGFGRLALKRIEAFTQKNNVGSKMLLLKSKFVQHPTRIDEGFPENIIFELSN